MTTVASPYFWRWNRKRVVVFNTENSSASRELTNVKVSVKVDLLHYTTNEYYSLLIIQMCILLWRQKIPFITHQSLDLSNSRSRYFLVSTLTKICLGHLYFLHAFLEDTLFASLSLFLIKRSSYEVGLSFQSLFLPTWVCEERVLADNLRTKYGAR